MIPKADGRNILRTIKRLQTLEKNVHFRYIGTNMNPI